METASAIAANCEEREPSRCQAGDAAPDFEHDLVHLVADRLLQSTEAWIVEEIRLLLFEERFQSAGSGLQVHVEAPPDMVPGGNFGKLPRRHLLNSHRGQRRE